MPVSQLMSTRTGAPAVTVALAGLHRGYAEPVEAVIV